MFQVDEKQGPKFQSAKSVPSLAKVVPETGFIIWKVRDRYYLRK
jgi:hypothetical protein